jgi:hypothetical protein
MKLLFSFLTILLLNQKTYCQSDYLKNITEYKFFISNELGAEILERANIFDLGRSESVKFRVVTENDNFLHGGGRVLGLTKDDAIEGDDKGQTFGLRLNSLFEFEKGSVALSYLSELYSKSVQQVLSDGTLSEKNVDNDKFYTENAVRDKISLEIHKDISGKYYGIIGLSFEHVSDSGLGLTIQEIFHDLTEDFGNRSYSVVETGLNENILVGTIGLGKRYTIFKKGNFDLTGDIEVGFNASNADYLRTSFVNSSLNLIHKNSTFRFALEKDSKLYKKLGFSWTEDIYSTNDVRFGSYLGVYKQENYFTRDYFDIGNQEDVIYEYGFELEAKF